jgi:membrane fusion protein, multidrug efflux system
MSGAKAWLRPAAFLLLVALVLLGCDGAAAPQQVHAPLVPVRVSDVRLEPATQIVRYAAVIKPRIEADLGFRVSGKMIARLVETGDRVEIGTPLARLDPADLELQARAAEAQLVSARADAVNARNDFARYEQLRRGEWATQQEYDRRKAEMERSAARVREAEAQLNVAQNNRKYTTLVADSPGIVTAILAEPGQVMASGQAVLRMARQGTMEAVASIPESQLGALQSAAMSVSLWAMPGVDVEGRLRELAPMANAATRTYEVRVTLVDAPPGIQLGMTATLTASRARDGQIARLPLSALTKQGASPAVWVLHGDTLELRPVEIGAYAADHVVIVAGLQDREQIVSAGVHKLDPAMKVRPWTEPDR